MGQNGALNLIPTGVPGLDDVLTGGLAPHRLYLVEGDQKRTGDHERTVREMRFEKGLVIAEPLREFQGVLSGMPEFVGDAKRGGKSHADA